MHRHSRSWSERFLSRSHRTLKRTLAALFTASLVILWSTTVIDKLSGDAANLVMLFGLILAIVTGLPLGVLRLAESIAFWLMNRGVRRELPGWAEARGWRYEEGKPDSEAMGLVGQTVRLVTAHDRELGLHNHFIDPEKFDRRHVRDCVLHHPRERPALTFTITKMESPEVVRRFVAVRTGLALPAVTISDKVIDEVWVKTDHAVESVHFNERYNIRTKDPRNASAMVHPLVMDLFVNAPEALERVDIVHMWAVAWVAPGTTAHDLDHTLFILDELGRRAPEFLRNG